MDAEKSTDTNWYVLFTLVSKQSQLCNVLQSHELNSFIPMLEYYRRDQKEIAVKPWFPGYVFVKSELEQKEFDLFLQGLGNQKTGMIRQLKEEGASALRPEEIQFISDMMDGTHIVRMSYGTQKNKETTVTRGPLKKYQSRIVKVDGHDRYAFLDLKFMERQIKAGLTIDRKIMM